MDVILRIFELTISSSKILTIFTLTLLADLSAGTKNKKKYLINL
jgi:hypothetical protein